MEKKLKTGEEVVMAFRKRMEKTIRIGEEENEDFCPLTREK